MRIATWNVNSIRTRAPLVVDWLLREQIDVLALQEIKCRPDQFPRALFERAGYHLAIHGFDQWNGVAFASRHDITEVTRGFHGMPGFGDVVAGRDTAQDIAPNGLPLEARALGVTVAGMRLWSLYVPHGRAVDHPHFEYKLQWLRALREAAEGTLAEQPTLPLALMGDWNIAPFWSDVGDPLFIEGVSTHVSQAERDVFASFSPMLRDVVRPLVPEGYTCWDYQRRCFLLDQGMRIDFILGSQAFAERVTAASIHRAEREPSGEIKPSDHVPVVCALDGSGLPDPQQHPGASEHQLAMIFE